MNSPIVLVSCVKSKRQVASAAKDLYVSPLFLGMRRYAERLGAHWFILSAEHGLLEPDQVVAPYERTLLKMRKIERAEWATRVQAKLIELLPPHSDVVLLAGERYREELLPFLNLNGFSVQVPMAGLSLGRQLQWLKEHAR
jgi:hypothetical protein